jgi:hypothetical protein
LEEQMLEGFRFRKRADKSGGQAALYADLPGAPAGTWPSAGMEIVGDPPAKVRIPTSTVSKGLNEGWITGTLDKVVHRPGGPQSDLWAVTHTFKHYSTLTVCGTRYRVTYQPDKYADYSQATDAEAVEAFEGDDKTEVTTDIYDAGATRVDWFYDLELEV